MRAVPYEFCISNCFQYFYITDLLSCYYYWVVYAIALFNYLSLLSSFPDSINYGWHLSLKRRNRLLKKPKVRRRCTFPANNVLKKLKVRRGCTVPSQISWPSTEKSNSTEVFATTGSVDCCIVLPEIRFVGTSLREDNTRVLDVDSSPPIGDLPERGQKWTSSRP